MPSLLPGFEYDIFISYRHNDNRSGWVTDFVHALEEELAATLKEPLSIYFDKNPHDGLLESHSVDKSLEGKLKSLIFIPIISQTYCDSKSFAWRHEFCAFNKLAKEDSFGRDVKLSNGNVASRILPIKIHDLDPEDKQTIESELGGVLRAIEFIYKSGGVNRPLNSKDDEVRTPGKVLYRDQVNKVANAIKEIITAIKNPTHTSGQESQEKNSTLPRVSTNFKSRKTILLAAMAIMVALAIVYSVSQIIGPGDEGTEVLDKSIAVLPFVNMSNDPDQEYFGDGIAEEVINALSEVPELRVIGRTSSFQFKGKNLDLRKIGDSLKVAFVLEGSVRKSEEQLRISAQLVKTSNGSQVWSKKFDRKTGQDLDIQDEIAKTVSISLQASLLQGGVTGASGAKASSNQEAYELYLQGLYFFNKRGEGLKKGLECFQRAVALDSTFASAYAGIAGCYTLLSWYKYLPSESGIEKAKKWANKAITLDPRTGEAYAYLGFAALHLEYDWARAEEYLKKAIELSPTGLAQSTYSNFLLQAKGDALGAEKNARMAIHRDPFSFILYIQLGNSLLAQGKGDAALEALQKSADLNDRSEVAFTSLAAALIKMNRVEEAHRLIEKGILSTGRTQLMLISLIEILAKSGKMDQVRKVYDEIQQMNAAGEADFYTLGVTAAVVGKKDEALRYFELALDQKNSGFFNWSPYRPHRPQWLVALQDEPRYKKIMDRLAFPVK